MGLYGTRGTAPDHDRLMYSRACQAVIEQMQGVLCCELFKPVMNTKERLQYLSGV